MSEPSPYRSPSKSGAEHDAARLALRATTLHVEDYDHPTAKQMAVLAGGALVVGLTVAFEAALGWVTIAAVVIFVLRKRRETAMSSVVIVVENGRLSLVRPGLDASVPLRELRSVGLAVEDEPAFAVVGHGIREAALETVRGRAYVVFRTADRATPLLALPISQIECFEWIPKIRAFLKANGWSPEEAPPLDEPHEIHGDTSDDDDDE